MCVVIEVTLELKAQRQPLTLSMVVLGRLEPKLVEGLGCYSSGQGQMGVF